MRFYYLSLVTQAKLKGIFLELNNLHSLTINFLN
jgi:hypothetical protein